MRRAARAAVADRPEPPDAPKATGPAGVRGPTSVNIPAAMVARIVDHARAEAPNEACGIVLGTRPAALGGRPTRFVATRNALASPYRFEVDPAALLALTLEADDRGEVFWAIVHSHVRGPARPSETDVRLAFYPDALHLLVSLADDGPALADNALPLPDVRAWRMADGVVDEVGLLVGD